MCTAIELLKRNIRNFVVLEKSSGIGGTWRDNKYPGCCCDGAYGVDYGWAALVLKHKGQSSRIYTASLSNRTRAGRGCTPARRRYW